MITFETATRIWNCYREIEVGSKLISDIEQALKDHEDPTPIDSFGRRQKFSLGVPSGDNSQRLFSLEPRLAASVIRAHVASKQAELVEANEQARMELDAQPVVAGSPPREPPSGLEPV